MFDDAHKQQRDALRAYPEFAYTLIPAVHAGWKFVPPGHFEELRGVRVWPEETADAVLIRSQTDCYGLRLNPLGDRVWSLSGTLTEVMCALLELPAPWESHAPALVRGAAPRLWTL